MHKTIVVNCLSNSRRAIGTGSCAFRRTLKYAKQPNNIEINKGRNEQKVY